MNPRPSQLEIDLMRQALVLAATGRGHVEPNPMVGCIIVRADQILGSGYHERFGQPHAEPNALANCHGDTQGATAIVTLEPCCHTGKKTPPCVPALLRAGIGRVVIGHLDPNPSVAGQGAAQLRAAGVEVIAGVLEAHCQQLNAPFFSLVRHHRPYVTLKWAQSADGLMGGTGNTPRRISGPESSRLVHLLRTRCDAIMVSADTVIADNPVLTPREVALIRQPARIVLDTHLRTPESCRLVTTAREVPTWIFTSTPSPKADRLRAMGVNVQISPLLDGHLDLHPILAGLGNLRFTHLLVEAGPRLARAFLQQNLADRVWTIHSPKPLGEPDAPAAPEVPFPSTASRRLGEDTLFEYLNPASPVFFSPDASVDLNLLV